MIKRLKVYLFHFRRMWARFYRHSGPMMAAAISFYFLLSAVPLTLLGLSVFGMILGSPQRASDFILGTINLQRFFPQGTMHLREFFETFVSRAQVVSIVSLILLLFFSGGVFLTVESAINQVFERRENRPIWRQILFAYLLMFLTYLSLLGSSLMTVATMIAADKLAEFTGIPYAKLGIFWKVFWFVMPVLWVAFFFALIYRIIPHRKVPWRYAFVGGVFGGVAWEVAKRIFTIYITKIVKVNELYGGISVVLATFMWIFYTAAIFLLGGELVMSVMEEEAKGGELL